MFSRRTHGEECRVVLTIGRRRRFGRLIRMLARLLLAHQSFRQVVGNRYHGVSILAGMRDQLQPGMVWIDRLNHVGQITRVAHFFIYRGECIAKVDGVLLRRLGLLLAGLVDTDRRKHRCAAKNNWWPHRTFWSPART